jgi:hypothetical protein
MVRILVLATDPDLGSAVAAAMQALGTARLAKPPSPAAAQAELYAPDWDVCVVDVAFAGAALEARRGRGQVVLTATAWPPPHPALSGPPGATMVLPIPCSLARLRAAVRTTAQAAKRAV